MGRQFVALFWIPPAKSLKKRKNQFPGNRERPWPKLQRAKAINVGTILRGSIAPHGALAVMATAPSASRTKTVKPAGPVRRGVGASFLLDARALPADWRADDHHSMAGREGFDFARRHVQRLEEKLLKTSRYKYPEHPNVGFG